MKDDYTHISVILDRTGSIESIRDDTIGGFNAFLDEQKKQPGTATLTLVQFDSQDSMKSSMISNCIATLVMGITYQDVHDDALENYSFPPSHFASA